MKWLERFRGNREHHVVPWPAGGIAAQPSCCCGWAGVSTRDPLAGLDQWTNHAWRYGNSYGVPCTREAVS